MVSGVHHVTCTIELCCGQWSASCHMYDRGDIVVSGVHDVIYDRVMLLPVACMMLYVR